MMTGTHTEFALGNQSRLAATTNWGAVLDSIF